MDSGDHKPQNNNGGRDLDLLLREGSGAGGGGGNLDPKSSEAVLSISYKKKRGN